MINFVNTRRVLLELPRATQQTVRAWLRRGIPRTAQILIEYEQLYQALKSDLAGDTPHTS